MIIHHFLNDIKKLSCKLKEIMKNDENKFHLKNEKVEHVLTFHIQIVSLGKKKLKFDRMC